MTTTTPELLTVPEVAERLKIKPRTVYTIIERGELKSVRVSAKLIRVRMSDLMAFINRDR